MFAPDNSMPESCNSQVNAHLKKLDESMTYIKNNVINIVDSNDKQVYSMHDTALMTVHHLISISAFKFAYKAAIKEAMLMERSLHIDRTNYASHPDLESANFASYSELLTSITNELNTVLHDTILNENIYMFINAVKELVLMCNDASKLDARCKSYVKSRLDFIPNNAYSNDPYLNLSVKPTPQPLVNPTPQSRNRFGRLCQTLNPFTIKRNAAYRVVPGIGGRTRKRRRLSKSRKRKMQKH